MLYVHPHLGSELALVIDPCDVKEELEEVKGPLEDMLEDVEMSDFETGTFPGLFAP